MPSNIAIFTATNMKQIVYWPIYIIKFKALQKQMHNNEKTTSQKVAIFRLQKKSQGCKIWNIKLPLKYKASQNIAIHEVN